MRQQSAAQELLLLPSQPNHQNVLRITPRIFSWICYGKKPLEYHIIIEIVKSQLE